MMLLEMSFVISLLSANQDPEVELEHHCLIENAIYEAISEGQKGMQLVTEVVLNRYYNDFRTDSTMCGTVYKKLQFSWTRKPKSQLRKYSKEEYLKAAQVVFSVVYGKTERILPRKVHHYLNVNEANDQSWYKPSQVVYQYKHHQFLLLNDKR